MDIIHLILNNCWPLQPKLFWRSNNVGLRNYHPCLSSLHSDKCDPGQSSTMNLYKQIRKHLSRSKKNVASKNEIKELSYLSHRYSISSKISASRFCYHNGWCHLVESTLQMKPTPPWSWWLPISRLTLQNNKVCIEMLHWPSVYCAWLHTDYSYLLFITLSLSLTDNNECTVYMQIFNRNIRLQF